jgi:alkylation response protein AidB-like acyl-CoA dehydrogenase
MGYIELDYTLSDETKAMLETTRKYAMEVVRPAGIELDKLPDPGDVIAKDSVLWDVFKQHRELGLHKIGIPKALGGMAEDVDPMARTLISETMGYADGGLAISFGAGGLPYFIATQSPEPVLQQLVRDYAEDTEANLVGCWAITEPDHGSDWILASQPGMDDPKCTPSVKAELKGDEYIINGQKAAWVSNGTIATHAMLHMSLDPSKAMHGTGIAIMPLDLPGISRGKPLDKVGQRALNQGELFFEDVKLPKQYMMIPDPAMGSVMIDAILTAANTGMAVLWAGMAQAPYDEALQYAKERIQGGVPIFEHQNIKLKLFNMFGQVESARAFARKVSAYNAGNPPGSMAHAMAAKILSTDAAFKVSSEAIQIFGGNGLSREYVVEKMFRDARAAMIEDGVNETLALGGASKL